MACNINDKLMTVTDRFLKYVTFDTESSETTGVTPSTPGQRVFAEALVKELEEIGLEDITLDDKSYLMATLPANTAKEVPTIGFIAHLDTSPDMSGKDVEPVVSLDSVSNVTYFKNLSVTVISLSLILQAIKVIKVSLTTKKSCAFLHMIFLISSDHISLETTASVETMRTNFAFRYF
jgi:di/tripeptidase